MDTLLKQFKTLLRIEDRVPDADADLVLERDVQDYVQILSSSKFANTNSDTKALERLMIATDTDDPIKIPPSQFDATWETPAQPSPALPPLKLTDIIHVPKSHDVDGEIFEQPSAEVVQADTTTRRRPQKFMDRLNRHLQLLHELEDEYCQILSGQPVYEPAKFGKEGGTNFKLFQFNPPKFIFKAMRLNDPEMLKIKGDLVTSNYAEKFQNLLWTEEVHQAAEMRRFDMQDVFLAKFDDHSYIVAVPGLAEGRPSLMRGDKLILKSNNRSTIYEGYIHDVRERDVEIKLHHSLSRAATEGLVFDVSFISSRTPFRRCHHAITCFKRDSQLRQIAFPKPRAKHPVPKIDIKESSAELRCFMNDLNKYQRDAVVHALKNQCRPAPYIIFGPPGTGKSVTMVEAAFQIYARLKGSKILICANSNTSTDLIAQRIHKRGLIPKRELVRITAFHRFQNELIPLEIKDISLSIDDISCDMFSNYRIVITTCTQAGVLNEFNDKFDFVLIDEAGHANEPESMIPISQIKNDGCCIIAGDPHQLGPVCMSNIASAHGLGQSLLERLSVLTVYQQHSVEDQEPKYDPIYISKLIISYRSDPRVMCINNELFYKNELQFRTKTPKKWLELLKADNPLTFHPVKGKDRREYVNPSWFNANEAIRCLTYVNALYRAGLKPEQLGIITPYRRQIEKLNTLLDSCKLRRCKVATMEEFQGDEREIIIISTVRSRPKNLEFDKKFNLGFLFDAKRFNVGVSRAKWLVIVVGDPEILKMDENWKKYVEKAFKLDTIESLN